jgi:hypothetical protein
LRIAEEKLANDEASLYFCFTEKGASHLMPLELDLFGNIVNWPKDFFGDEMAEIAAMQQAILDRKRRARA